MGDAGRLSAVGTRVGTDAAGDGVGVGRGAGAVIADRSALGEPRFHQIVPTNTIVPSTANVITKARIDGATVASRRERPRDNVKADGTADGSPRDVTPGGNDGVPTSSTFSAGDEFAFSPDGAELAFTAPPLPIREQAWSTNHDIWTVNLATGQKKNLRRAVAQRFERDPFSIGRPARVPIVFRRVRELARRGARRGAVRPNRNQPDVAVRAVLVLEHVGDDVGHASAVRGDLRIGDAFEAEEIFQLDGTRLLRVK